MFKPKDFSQREFDELVPDDHLLRLIDDKYVGFSFLLKKVRSKGY
jgi:hypothetical protein